MPVKHWNCDCSENGADLVEVVARADYQKIYDELLGISQDDGKVERAMESLQEELTRLQAINAASRAVIIVAASHGIRAAELFLMLFPDGEPDAIRPR